MPGATTGKFRYVSIGHILLAGDPPGPNSRAFLDQFVSAVGVDAEKYSRGSILNWTPC